MCVSTSLSWCVHMCDLLCVSACIQVLLPCSGLSLPAQVWGCDYVERKQQKTDLSAHIPKLWSRCSILMSQLKSAKEIWHANSLGCVGRNSSVTPNLQQLKYGPLDVTRGVLLNLSSSSWKPWAAARVGWDVPSSQMRAFQHMWFTFRMDLVRYHVVCAHDFQKGVAWCFALVSQWLASYSG